MALISYRNKSKMICFCGEKAFTFTSITCRHGKKYTCFVGKCNKTKGEIYKKKKKCSFEQEEVLEVNDIELHENAIETQEVKSVQVKNKNDYVNELYNAIDTIKMCQDVGRPFAKYTNKILYISKQLNIPPYIEDKYTIDEYCKIVEYYLKNPVKEIKNKPAKKYSLIEELELEKSDHDYINQILKIDKSNLTKLPKNMKAKKTIFINNPLREFKTGGVDTELENDEDELDIEQFDSEDEDEYCEDDYTSD